MRSTARRSLRLAALLAAGCTCAESHRPPADGSVADAGVDPRDDCLPPWEAQNFPTIGGLDTTCSPERLRDCAVGAARLADGLGEPVTMCIAGFRGCAMADECRDDPVFGYCPCGDGDEICGSVGHVCVRSAPGERPHCEEVCVREGPIPRACASEAGPVPPARLHPSMSPPYSCDDWGRRNCRLWAQFFAPQGWAHGSCAPSHNELFCGMGDTCVPGEIPERPLCDCAGAVCALDEVCVSDTPEGVPRCEPACLPPI